MVIKNFLLSFASVYLIISCTEKNDKVEPKLPDHYTSSKIVSGYFSVQGGIVDQNHLLTFASPFYGKEDPVNPIVKPALYKVSTTGLISKQYTFEKGNFNGIAFPFTPTTRAGNIGKHPFDVRVEMVKNSKGEVFVSNKADQVFSVTKIFPEGISCDIAQKGVIALTLAQGDTLYALTSQTYYQIYKTGQLPVYEVLEPMKIWRIGPDCSISEYYRFPVSFTYFVGGGYTGSPTNEWLPTENEADMCVTQNGDILISLMLSENVYRLTKNKILEEFITTIDSPSGITTDKYDNVYVVSAPSISATSFNTFETTKPVQIYRIINEQPAIIYQGELNQPYAESHYYVPELKRWYITDMQYNINVTQDLKVYLEDYIGGEIIVLQ